MDSRSAIRLAWAAPVLAGLTLSMVSCSGEDHYYQVGPPTYPITSVAVGDLNGDHKVDIVDAIYAGGGGVAQSGWVSVRLQDPANAGSFFDPVRSSGGANPAGLVLARLSPAGNPGVVVVNRQLVYDPKVANTVSVLFPDPALAGSFKAPVALPLGARNPAGAAVADLDGDTWPDVVVAADGDSSLLLFSQQAPGGTFAAPVALAVGGEPTAVAIADVNGDHLPDIVAVTTGNNVSVLLQDPENPGHFLAHVDYPVGSNPVALKVADLDGDGRPDIVVVNYGTGSASASKGLSILFQAHAPAAAGSFGAAVALDTGDAYASAVDVGDLNGDSLPDLVVANAGVPGDPGSVSVLLQDPAAAGTFKAPVLYRGVQGPTSVAIADVDGDDLPDLVIGDGNLFVRKQLTGQPGIFGLPYPYKQ